MKEKLVSNQKFVAGHTGLVGSAIIRFKTFGYKNIITIRRKNLDLRNQNEVYKFIKNQKPDVIINAAATVGGIYANNKYRAIIYNNISIQSNIIHSSYKNSVKQLIFLGSSCVYPKIANNL